MNIIIFNKFNSKSYLLISYPQQNYFILLIDKYIKYKNKYILAKKKQYGAAPEIILPTEIILPNEIEFVIANMSGSSDKISLLLDITNSESHKILMKFIQKNLGAIITNTDDYKTFWLFTIAIGLEDI